MSAGIASGEYEFGKFMAHAEARRRKERQGWLQR